MLKSHIHRAFAVANAKLNRTREKQRLAPMRKLADFAEGPLLSIEAYDAAETTASIDLSVPHLMAFTPIAYQQVGWPHRVRDRRELVRLADHNFEAEISGLFALGARFDPVGYRNSFTHDEGELLAAVRDKVRVFTKEWFGRQVAPVSNILVQMGPYRMLRQLAAAFGVERLSVFEAGPGAGYLGAFLAETEQKYASYDIAQSYYLWQSCLMQATGGSDFAELASMDNAAISAALKEARVVHLPWWNFASMLTDTPLRADVIYSNSNLSEMSRVSLRMLLQVGRTILQDSKIGAFAFFSKGMPAQTPHDMFDQEFGNFGYHKVMEEPFHAYTLRPDQGERIQNVFADGIMDYNPSGRGGSLSAREVTPLRRDEAPLDTQLTQWFHGWEPPFID